MTRSRLATLVTLTAALTLLVIVLGAYVRLSNAGLSCPDWPGCYGQIAAPTRPEAVERATAAFPERPVETAKAWKEMIHRYLAATLGLAILAILVISIRGRKDLPIALPLALLALVIFQSLLGMWTVTLLVKPLIVTLHLLGGMSTLALLWYLRARLRGGGAADPRLWRLGLLGLLLLVAQIALGGWTSSNYAAIVCPGFPGCRPGAFWPALEIAEAFQPWRGLGVNYEYGVLGSGARATIHMVHRAGAVLTLAGLVALGLYARRLGQARAGLALVAAVSVQVVLGASVVLLGFPLLVAAAHNAGAAITLVALVGLLARVRG